MDANLEELRKYSIENLSDAMDYLKLKGVIRGFKTISDNTVAVGKAFTVKFCKNSDSEKCVAADYIDDVPEDSLIVIDNEGIEYCTVWGNILTEMALIKKVNGTIINGACRDVSFIKSMKYPLFSKAVNCKTGKGVVQLESVKEQLNIDGITIKNEDYIFVEEGTVLVIPKEHVKNVLEIAENIERTEENIVKAIRSGMLLKEARKQFNYNKYK